MILDIFSRKAIRWEVHATENGDLAKTFIEHAITANGGINPGAIHADNGTSMTSKTVTQPVVRPEDQPQPFPAARIQRQSRIQKPSCRVAGRDLTCPPPQIRT